MKNVSSMPRLSTSFVIISATGNLLLFRRNDAPAVNAGKLHMFAGKVELGETTIAAAHREIKEELNINVQERCWKQAVIMNVEEIYPDRTDLESGAPNMHHWLSVVYGFWMKDELFENVEPDKHPDTAWYNPATLDPNDCSEQLQQALITMGPFKIDEQGKVIVNAELFAVPTFKAVDTKDVTVVAEGGTEVNVTVSETPQQ